VLSLQNKVEKLASLTVPENKKCQTKSKKKLGKIKDLAD